MLKRLGGLWKPKNPHSLEHLKYLYSVLSKNQTVTESNKSLLVETIRSIAEILIWGDQNDSSVFDFFLERNMHSFFLKFMDQKTGKQAKRWEGRDRWKGGDRGKAGMQADR